MKDPAESTELMTSRSVPTWASTLLFLYLISLNLFFLALILAAWPDTRALVSRLPDFPLEIRVFMVSLGGGGLGSVVTLLMSFISYAGNRELRTSWLWWYLARPFVGMSLGFIVYAGIRGGVIKTTAGADVLNLYFVTIVAAFAGLFSRQILDRFSDWGRQEQFRGIMGSLFRDRGRGDQIVEDDCLGDS